MKYSIVVLFLLSLLLTGVFANSSSSSNEDTLDERRNITQLIAARGYPFEQHEAITPDGYVLSIQRIPAGRYQSNPNPYGSNGKQVVFLQHGVEDIGTTWVMQENVYQSLGFILADQGYDVWINNVRGTTYSNENLYYNITSREYWAFSFDEMAKYDIPTAIDYVMGVSQVEKINYVGHSQGTTVAFIAFSYNETLSSKINLFIALAPVVRVTHCKSELLDVLADLNAEIIFEILGDRAFLPDTPFLQKYLPELCKSEPIICESSLALIMGWDTQNINQTRLPVYMAHEPGGTSVQNAAHWAQATQDGYQMFDYGIVGNLEHYGSIDPPQYDISLFHNQVAIFYGGNDYLADPTDVEWLIPQLGNNVIYQQYIASYSHLDFVWGETAYEDIYGEIVTLFDQYPINN
ncbi:hypothetical protein DLAC_01166 [Tieghemostelium lacteum]|uniref:Lipase n=1 Tax=Tieghemostelium lacteum TaxID=361077 RepID=A0A152A880_TIELA|nr:hypothetical protein DLAC_01166 [Tieghemostelium lacteum]|eukprot:KYR02335.1 hypothetical protein DLAC_01166 [Tieghemostelium lacteum]